MNNSIRTITLLSTLAFFAFTPIENSKNTENKFKLNNLKQAHPPMGITMLKPGNIAHGKDILEKGVLITYKNRYAEKVRISGDFTNWKPVEMERGRYGIWYYFLNSMLTDKPARYKFIVDGIWTHDPENKNREGDNAGAYVSLIKPFRPKGNNMLTYRVLDHGFIEFRLYRPDAKFISLVGDFNNWNPENDILQRDENGIWTVRKRLSPGMYRYNYIIDGEWTIDLFNENTGSNDTGDICSMISIKK